MGDFLVLRGDQTDCRERRAEARLASGKPADVTGTDASYVRQEPARPMQLRQVCRSRFGAKEGHSWASWAPTVRCT